MKDFPWINNLDGALVGGDAALVRFARYDPQTHDPVPIVYVSRGCAMRSSGTAAASRRLWSETPI